MSILQNHSALLKTLCEQHFVKQLYAFGSVLTDEFRNNSDIDLMVNFWNLPLEQYADNYFSLKFALEDVFKRRVDLLEESAIKNPYFKKEIAIKQQLVYER